MAEKKDRSRFSLKFREGDPAHERTIQILESRGKRNIAPFIVNAVLHYVQCSETPDIAHLLAENMQSVRNYRVEDESRALDKLQPVMNRKEIEQIVREILREYGQVTEKFKEKKKVDKEACIIDNFIGIEDEPQKEITPKANIDAEDVMYQNEISEEMKKMITKSITGFRRI